MHGNDVHYVYESTSAEETMAIATELAACFHGGETIILRGDLGAGKTVFAKGVARALGIEPDTVLSPTFTLHRTYAGTLVLNHCDLYRLADYEEAYAAGIVELIGREDAVLLVEWAEPIQDAIALPYIVTIEKRDGDGRHISVTR